MFSIFCPNPVAELCSSGKEFLPVPGTEISFISLELVGTQKRFIGCCVVSWLIKKGQQMISDYLDNQELFIHFSSALSTTRLPEQSGLFS